MGFKKSKITNKSILKDIEKTVPKPKVQKPKKSTAEKMQESLCVAAKLKELIGITKITPEFKFHPERRWKIDYYIEHKGKRVALEVEGGIYTGGRHINPTGFLKDMEKYNAMAVMGIYLYRCTPNELHYINGVVKVDNEFAAKLKQLFN